MNSKFIIFINLNNSRVLISTVVLCTLFTRQLSVFWV